MRKQLFFVILAIVASYIPASADTISYVNWTTSSPGAVSGTLFGGTVNVTYTGEVSFAQINGVGSNFWSPASTFTSATVSNAPPNADLIAITGSPSFTNTVTFSAPVSNLIMDLMSLGQPGVGTTYIFNSSFTILQVGPSTAFGGGPNTLTQSGNTLTGNEGDGVIRFQGPVTTLSWTGTNPEFWNGFTFGAPLPVVSPVPEPGTLLLVGTGLVSLLGRAMKHKKSL